MPLVENGEGWRANNRMTTGRTTGLSGDPAGEQAGEQAGEVDAVEEVEEVKEVKEVKEVGEVGEAEEVVEVEEVEEEGGSSAVGEGGVTKPVESLYTVEGEVKEASVVESDAASEEGAASSS